MSAARTAEDEHRIVAMAASLDGMFWAAADALPPIEREQVTEVAALAVLVRALTTSTEPERILYAMAKLIEMTTTTERVH